MTGPEHYAEAERLVNKASNTVVTTENDCPPNINDDVRELHAAAQVHATLALAAATFAAGTFADRSQSVPSGAQWSKALL